MGEWLWSVYICFYLETVPLKIFQWNVFENVFDNFE